MTGQEVGARARRFLQAVWRALAVTCGLLLALLVLDRLVLAPRPASWSFLAAAGALTAGTVLGVAVLALLRKGRTELAAGLTVLMPSALAAFVASDLVVGRFLLAPVSPPYISDPVVHHRALRGSRSFIESSEFSYVQHVNALGLRGPAIPRTKAAGTYRVLLLGDSFTMGRGVPDTATFAYLTERALAAAPDATLPRIEILNGGMDSYAPVVSLLEAKELIPQLSPDLVVLNFDMSDLVQEHDYRLAAIRDSSGAIVAIPGPTSQDEGTNWASGVSRFVDLHLPITRFLLASLPRTTQPGTRSLEPSLNAANRELLRHTLAAEADTTFVPLWNEAEESILGLNDYCQERGIGFMLTAYPWGHQVSDREWRAGRSIFLPPRAQTSDRTIAWLHRLADRNSIPLVDMFPAFRSYAGKERLYFNQDMHWTEAGHRLAAQEVTGAVKEWVRHHPPAGAHPERMSSH